MSSGQPGYNFLSNFPFKISGGSNSSYVAENYSKNSDSNEDCGDTTKFSNSSSESSSNQKERERNYFH